MKKLKVLIVTYYWPPSGGGGVQRWLKLSGYLPEFGVEPVIFTPENPAFHLKDESLVQEVSEDIEVWKFPIWEPLKYLGKGGNIRQGQVLEKSSKSIWDRIMIWARATLFIPDPRVFWVSPSVKFLMSMLKRNQIDVVITTGPPHSMHLIGRELKRKTGVKWVADFRDPWSEWDILEKLGVKGWAKTRHRALEKSVLGDCDLLITVSDSWAKDFARLGAPRAFVLPNGFDPTPKENGLNKASKGKFVVSHIGMLNEMRNPVAVWEALSALCVENRDFASKLEIYLAGILSDRVLASIASYPELKSKLVVDGYLSHKSARKAMKESSLLLLVMNESANARGHIPGKLFEYVEARTPILAIGDPDGDAAQILTKTQAGAAFSFDDSKSVRKEIEERYRTFENGEVFSSKDIDQYSRRSQAMKLANELFKMTLKPTKI